MKFCHIQYEHAWPWGECWYEHFVYSINQNTGICVCRFIPLDRNTGIVSSHFCFTLYLKMATTGCIIPLFSSENYKRLNVRISSPKDCKNKGSLPLVSSTTSGPNLNRMASLIRICLPIEIFEWKGRFVHITDAIQEVTSTAGIDWLI